MPDDVPAGTHARQGSRQRDGWLIIAVLGVLLMLPVHGASLFVGFVLRPERFIGDYWSFERECRIAMLVAKELGALLVLGCGVLGASGRQTTPGRRMLGGIAVIVALVFAGYEAWFEIAALGDIAAHERHPLL